MSEALTELATLIETKRPDCVVSWEVKNDELTIHVTKSSFTGFCDYLRTERVARFNTLVDITAVDYPSRPNRFDVVYHFLSMYTNQRVRLKVALRDDEMMPTLTEVFPAANWFEREIFDMFGIIFTGHPDLRRILTDYGFRGHPLLKDFPTTGYTEVRYDEAEKRV
ncbi:MAG: NADH-quinone oxidoreductase subunit C, partial [Pseudomonadota bacterium]